MRIVLIFRKKFTQISIYTYYIILFGVKAARMFETHNAKNKVDLGI